MSSEGCWPSVAQERLLQVCFAPEGAAEFATWRALVDPANIETASQRFLPLLYRRWGERMPDAEVRALSHRAWLAVWMQNRQRLSLAAEILRDLEHAGIDGVLLKGAALTLRHYRDSGVRPMGDIDVLVAEEQAIAAWEALAQSGWKVGTGLSRSEIERQRRVRHAWQLRRGASEDCDLHWRPVVRCFAPVVGERFRSSAETVDLLGRPAKVPCPTDQLFHVCAHGMQWHWTPQIRWIADALTVLRTTERIDWERLRELAQEAQMTVRLSEALEYLRTRFGAAIPEKAVPQARAAAWERDEYALLQKRCPLSPADRLRWHLTNFRRIRPFDREWQAMSAWRGFAEYLATFTRS